MRVVANTPLIAKRMVQGRNLSLAGLACMGVALVFSFSPSTLAIPLGGQTYEVFSAFIGWGLLVVGYIFSNVSLYLNNTFGGPRLRPDAALTEELRGLDNSYALVHHFKPLAHVLLGPHGAYALTAKPQTGLVRFLDGRWKQDMPLRFLRLMFVPFEGIGNPGREAEQNAAALEAHLKKAGIEDVPVQPLIVFLNPGTQLRAEESPIPAVHVKKLLSHLRATAGQQPADVPRASLDRALVALAGPHAQATAPETPAAPEAAGPAKPRSGRGAKRVRRRK